MHPKTESPGLTPPTLTSQMRGRGREVQAVLELLASVAVGRSAILQVDGAPGIGKSRLLTEAQARATDRGFSLATGYAGGLPPSLPLAQLFAGLDVEPPRCVVAGEPSNRSEV